MTWKGEGAPNVIQVRLRRSLELPIAVPEQARENTNSEKSLDLDRFYVKYLLILASSILVPIFFESIRNPYFNSKIQLKIAAKVLYHNMLNICRQLSLIDSPLYVLQTSKYFLGLSVITPSTSFLILQRIHCSSLTVHKNIERPAFLTSRINLAPSGPTRIFWSMLKETLGIARNFRA